MRRVTRILATFLFLPLAIPLSCIQPVDYSGVDGILSKIKKEHAPDSRLKVWDIHWRQDSQHLVVEGFVGDAATKVDLIHALEESGYGQVQDAITILPDSSIEKPSGIVSVSVANVRGEPRHSAELVTQVLMGGAVELSGVRVGGTMRIVLIAIWDGSRLLLLRK